MGTIDMRKFVADHGFASRMAAEARGGDKAIADMDRALADLKLVVSPSMAIDAEPVAKKDTFRRSKLKRADDDFVVVPMERAESTKPARPTKPVTRVEQSKSRCVIM